MSLSKQPHNVTTNRELRRRRWLSGIEKLIPQMLDKAEQEGGIVVVAQLGHKRPPDGRISSSREKLGLCIRMQVERIRALMGVAGVKDSELPWHVITSDSAANAKQVQTYRKDDINI